MGSLSQKAFYTSPGAIRAVVIFNLPLSLLLANIFDIEFKKLIKRELRKRKVLNKEI